MNEKSSREDYKINQNDEIQSHMTKIDEELTGSNEYIGYQ